jgi:hypothetical protein
MNRKERREFLKMAAYAKTEKTFISEIPKQTLEDAIEMLYETSEEFIVLDDVKLKK